MNKQQSVCPPSVDEERRTIQVGFRQFRASVATVNALAAALELWESDLRESLVTSTAVGAPAADPS